MMKTNTIIFDNPEAVNENAALPATAAQNAPLFSRVHSVLTTYPVAGDTEDSSSYPLVAMNRETLLSLRFVLEQLTPGDYISPVSEMANTPLSRHVRHILDFYRNLLLAGENGIIAYDSRKRGSDIETNKHSAIWFIDRILAHIEAMKSDRPVVLRQDLGSGTLYIKSSLNRELLYNLEHAIHHMALIKIALNLHFNYVLVDANFGIAYSTVAASRN